MSDFGRISDYIIGAAVKEIRAVECDPKASNQHELNGVRAMRDLFGASGEFMTKFIRLEDDESKTEVGNGKLTWYDARENHPTRSEFRFYYQNNPAIDLCRAGDLLAVILKRDGNVLFITAADGSQSANYLVELFGTESKSTFEVLNFEVDSLEVSFSKRIILEELGIELKANFGIDYLTHIENAFGALVFPSTKEFSALARSIAGASHDLGCADSTILNWYETEEAMFRQLEGQIIDKKLASGFQNADEFLEFSQSIRQRRYSRAGRALENHIAQLFIDRGIQYSWDKVSEGKKRPDFIFPSIEQYHSVNFPVKRLTMLGVKTTCKDRWRQVISEADRLEQKHLFTLQPAISSNQTDEMIEAKVQLVIPESIHQSYKPDQRSWLWSTESFIDFVKYKQAC